VIGEPLTPSDGDEIELTASIGAAVASDPATPPEDLIAQADGAMYRSKQHGGGRAQLPGREVRQRTHEVMVLEHELEHAIASGELSVYFQPRIGLGSGDLDGLEALVRWPHPQRGLLAPSEFLAVAEQSGLIVALGSVVADQAFSGLRLLRRGAPRATVSINLSPRELRDPSLPSLLADLAGAYELEPGAVVVEVSERAVDSDPPAAEAALSRLKHEGICVAIDDFGTGAASLSRVGRLPIDQLKLHESMVARLDHDDRHAEQFVGAAIDLGHALGLSVVAEGVETERQLERLRALGCDCAQGNLLGPPRPAGDFLGGGR
jgi:EAL domain-containing protein (putative c-di-GMP-specific phosphodiesterase class I)